MLTLRRAYLPEATLGVLTVGDETFRTIELPWRGNARSESCIPEGVYRMAKRSSGVVRRSTDGEYNVGWEVTDVPGRSLIMLHVGNWVKNTDGCLLIGSQHSWTIDGPMVRESRESLRRLMGLLEARGQWDIDIRVNQPEYP
jgi:hypothetical protein